MGSSNVRGILTSFSPSLNFLAICSGDGRIKVWDAIKGQIQTEFADIFSNDDGPGLFGKPQKGHLSMDYTCMKWISLDKKKKRKLESTLLVLGTGGGDVLALDVSAGQLKWRVSDCHPGGVSSISSPKHDSCIYTAGADGMICKLNSMTGNLLEKFKASTKAISSLSVSSDGNVLAIGSAQMKVFNCSDHKKIQKFSGHPGPICSMTFTDDGKYILSSASSERYIAIWKLDGGKKKSACCVLAMDHPAVFLDSCVVETEDTDSPAFYVLAISETGICYFWYGQNIEELSSSKPTKISLSVDFTDKAAIPAIFASKLQGVVKPASVHIFLAHGLLVKPSFEKILVNAGTDVKLSCSLTGILLPNKQAHKKKKRSNRNDEVTALDRANAEDALLPIPKILGLHDKKGSQWNSDKLEDELIHSRSGDEMEIERPAISMENKLKDLGIINYKKDIPSELLTDSTKLLGLSIEDNVSQKKMRTAVLSLEPSEAFKLLELSVAIWQLRVCSGNHVLPWICCILVNHSDFVVSQEPSSELFDSLHKLTQSRATSVQSLFQLSGRLQLIGAQIEKAVQNKNHQTASYGDSLDESEDDEDVLYGEEEEEGGIPSGSSSDNDE
ncbi:WD repeat-containing protein 36-like [Impatiens glandulifera]|uniref:WD repeat-containing protein 36-like n=1 Tax=Impatiens glandulifera TaxID=253017 RepID=UPI001FB192C1|nr:WD repeat-containing protein 36-like [Impatiens glandulifera]